MSMLSNLRSLFVPPLRMAGTAAAGQASRAALARANVPTIWTRFEEWPHECLGAAPSLPPGDRRQQQTEMTHHLLSNANLIIKSSFQRRTGGALGRL